MKAIGAPTPMKVNGAGGGCCRVANSTLQLSSGDRLQSIALNTPYRT